jgi:CoA:oxalate CoA-transferase
VREVVTSSDVVLDGLPPAALAAANLGADAIRSANPALIWCDVSTFGRDTPFADLPGCDIAAQAMSGFMATTGFADDPPTSAGFPLAEHAAGAFAVTAVLASLFHRSRTGRGQSADIAAVDCLAYFLSSFLPAVFTGGAVPTRQGFRHPLIAPWDAYDAKDGKVVICSGNNAHWHAILRLIGRADLVDDERFSTSERRVARVEDINALIQAWIGDLRAEDAIGQLHRIGIPAGPILDLEQVFAHPHFHARRMLVPMHDAGRDAYTLGSVYKMSRTPGGVSRVAPVLGSDNDAQRGGRRAPAKGVVA